MSERKLVWRRVAFAGCGCLLLIALLSADSLDIALMLDSDPVADAFSFSRSPPSNCSFSIT